MADSLWLNKNGEIIVKDGVAIICNKCPCECKPKILKSFSGKKPKCTSLEDYQGEGVGTPGYRWRLIEIGENGCGNTGYGSGEVNDKGVLVGLPPRFCFGYPYTGYMSLQLGCYDSKGNLLWPKTCDRN